MYLSENEYLIISLIWKENRPLTRAEILKGTPGRNWNPASIHLILNSMISKGVLRIVDEERKYARAYAAAITYHDYVIHVLKVAVPDKNVLDVLGDCQVIFKECNEKLSKGQPILDI